MMSASKVAIATIGFLFCAFGTAESATRVEVSVDWDKTIALSKTTPTLLVEPSPLLRPGAPIHDAAVAALKALDARNVRYHLWYPYPRLAVAELEPPTRQRTSWDFSLIDPEAIEFLNMSRGKEPIVNFSTIPAWMFKTAEPAKYPQDPNQATWIDVPYTASLVDPSGKQVAEYMARIVSWYTQGGFTDENGQFHASGHHYELPWWEVLNELDWVGPQQYTGGGQGTVPAP